jgi:crotonobetainyl-CoA:carnitine CoA-transferase CaiB-like acyl-CoA transferase
MAEHMGGLTFDPPLGPPGYSRMLAPDRRPHRTADGHICILPYTDRHWRDFFRMAGRPELVEDPRRRPDARQPRRGTLCARSRMRA